MEQILKKFEVLLEKEAKEEAVMFVLDQLQCETIDVLDLYSHVLTPSLNNMRCDLADKRICIWNEHVKSSIVRTIVECCFPYVIKKRDQINPKWKGTAAILCPPGEYHDLGARMATDFFTISGYSTIFVGSNTPYQDFYQAIHVIKPNVVAISVSNYYNLVATQKMIEEIRHSLHDSLTIVVGGSAFHNDTANKVSLVGADSYTSTYEEILNLNEKGVNV
ncbi:MAG: B12-binding domain-containing protein [Velocimicrobium sp.]